jgi:hypothetical protein
MLSLMLPDGTSTSFHSPGSMGVSSPLIRNPRAFRPPGRLESVPASTNCRMIAMFLLWRTPLLCGSVQGRRSQIRAHIRNVRSVDASM